MRIQLRLKTNWVTSVTCTGASMIYVKIGIGVKFEKEIRW